MKWDQRFLALARHISTWSKDPSTQAGAVIVDPQRRIVSVGFNGFARGVQDTDARLHARDVKYQLVIHAEGNALLFAQRPLTGCTIYTWPFPSCSVCASLIIQAGLVREVAPPLGVDKANWFASCELSRQLFAEAGVVFDILEPTCTH